jgi:hypothetical protein
MIMPIRVQQRRLRGWRMPPNSKSVTRSSKWGNRVITVEHAGSHEAAVAAYRQWAYASAQAAFRERARCELRGKNLACFCPPDKPCHADVLLEIANSEEPSP